MNFNLYCIDAETTGVDPIKHDPIEISIKNIFSGEQKTWYLKPLNFDTIEAAALKINGYNIDDIKGLTAEGREKFRDPKKVIVEIENWLNEDNYSSSNRLMVGQAVGFDKNMLISLWDKCGYSDTFPFSVKYMLDTMQIEFMMDLAKGQIAEGYNLNSLTKKYGIKNEKAHKAEEDVKATTSLFLKQIEILKKLFNDQNNLRSE